MYIQLKSFLFNDIKVQILDMLYKNKKLFLFLNIIKNKVQKSKSDTN